MPGPYGLTSTGFNAKPLDVIQTEIKDSVRGAISPTLNLGTRSLIGQLIGAFSSQCRQVWEASQAVYASMDPNQAEGDALTARAELTGTERDAATASFALMTITLAAGTYGAGTLLVNRVGDSTAVFANRSSITTAGATLTGQIFDCITTGPVSAPAGTLTIITSPVSGFSAPTNPADAELGQLVESDPQLRERRHVSVQRAGSSNVNAITADLLENNNVTFATVVENDTHVTDGNGVPAFSIAAVVEGGTDAEVAQIIFDSKAGGPPTHGAVTVTVYDAGGRGHAIKFTRPNLIPFTLRVTYSWLSTAFVDAAAAEAAVEAAITPVFEKLQGVGKDIITSAYISALNVGSFNPLEIQGIVDATVEWTFNFYEYFTTNATISPFERATLYGFEHVPTMVTGAP